MSSSVQVLGNVDVFFLGPSLLNYIAPKARSGLNSQWFLVIRDGHEADK